MDEERERVVIIIILGNLEKTIIHRPVSVVVVYQCPISDVMYTGDNEALFVLVHAMLDC